MNFKIRFGFQWILKSVEGQNGFLGSVTRFQLLRTFIKTNILSLYIHLMDQ